MSRMHRKIIGYGMCVLICGVMIAGCGKGKEADPEAEGQIWLSKAREALRDADYSLSRIYIDSLRTRSRMALNAREEGIILLDSVELAEAREQLAQAEFTANQSGLDYLARDSVDTQLDRARMKVKFFEKKLSLDKEKRKQH